MSIISQIDLNIIGKLFNNTLVPNMPLAQDATYRKVSNNGFSPTTGTFTPDNADVSIKLIRKDFSLNKIATIDEDVLTTDVRFFIRPVTGVTLQATKDDLIIFNSETFRVKHATEHVMGSTQFVIEILAQVLR